MNVKSKNITNKITKYESDFKVIFYKILEYDKIAIITHKTPDFDALGSQYGLATFLRDNFPKKTVKVLGENSVVYTPLLNPEVEEVSDDFFSGALAIALDCGNADRLSEKRYKLAKEIIKIDHHPNVEPYGDINFVDDEASSVGELVALFLIYCGDKYPISPKAAHYLYSAIVGDTGRFKYSSTEASTFAVAELLLMTGFDITDDVYTKMYANRLEDLRTQAYILNNYVLTPNGFAYYVIDDETLKDLDIEPEQGKEYVNIFAGINEIKIWAAITEDVSEKRFRVSLRSASKPINHIAAKWHGGGHRQSSGASIYKKEDISKFAQDIDDYLSEH